jgi:hypothetical protein
VASERFLDQFISAFRVYPLPLGSIGIKDLGGNSPRSLNLNDLEVKSL